MTTEEQTSKKSENCMRGVVVTG